MEVVIRRKPRVLQGRRDDGEEDSTKGGMEENILLPRIGLVYAIKPNVSFFRLQ